jgi:hypothetical protein
MDEIDRLIAPGTFHGGLLYGSCPVGRGII